ncbi:MAG: phosphatase PAP2 family protein [bacterium]
MQDIKNLFYKIIENTAECYRGRNLLLQFGAFFLTYILVISGFDYWYFRHTDVLGGDTIFFLPALIGFLVPMVVPAYLYISGKIHKDLKIKNTAYALLQSAGVGLGMSSFYKTLTGRVPHAFRLISQSVIDNSHDFRFGFYRGGAFQGWPSSHTTVAFAMSFALVALYPGNNLRHKLIRYGAIIYAFYIGIGVSMNIHWFSDFVAGAILGAIIGTVIGKSFYKRIMGV